MTTYRYSLHRTVSFVGRESPVVVMLNPSTADETADDPTIRRLLKFARRESWAGFEVVNLFAARSTKPAALWRMQDEGADIVGPENDKRIVDALTSGGPPPIAAWGVLSTRGRRRLYSLLRVSVFRDAPWRCFGVASFGHPRHPLFVRADAPLVPWDAMGFLAARASE